MNRVKLALRLLAAAVLLTFVASRVVPQVLAFRYHIKSYGSEVWSETPLPPAELAGVLSRARSLVGQSALADRKGEARHISPRRAAGAGRFWPCEVGGDSEYPPPLELIVINRSNIAEDRVWNEQYIGGQRSLSSVIAHETCHGMERRRFGVAVQATAPTWLFEGYCDYVAQESSLSYRKFRSCMLKGARTRRCHTTKGAAASLRRWPRTAVM